MATFRVGQRFRVVNSEYGESIGREGTIISTDGLEVGFPYIVVLDGQAQEYSARPSWLAPIQPERNRMVAWEDCLIDPRKLVGEPA